jgi:hypothetical protein
VLEVLRTGLFSGVPPRQIEVARQPGGAPEVRLAGAAAKRASDAGVGRVSLSISHKDDLVVAVAVAGPAGPLAGAVEKALDTAIDSTLARKDLPCAGSTA